MKTRFSRQILAFGEEGQRSIEAQRVGIVGLGGIGSHVAQALAYFGVQSFVLVDDDYVEESNLNRLIGGTAKDVEKETLKIRVAERLVWAVAPAAKIDPIPQNLRSAKAIDALTSCTAIFGCVDHDGPRLVLMELACAYEITFIDCATEIVPDSKKSRIEDFGGRVVVCRPGDFCLACANEIDLEMAKAELESEDVRALRKAHGYGLGEEVVAPAVVSLNGIIANLAVTEFLVWTTGIREPFRKRFYRGMRGIILENKDVRRKDCYNCGYLVGKREAVNLYRYVKTQ